MIASSPSPTSAGSTPPGAATPGSPGPTPTTPAPTPAVEAAQAALAGEHACVYGYGVVGAHLPDDAEPAHEALAAHRQSRDALAALIAEAGATPAAALSGYALPVPVTDEVSASALAATIEERLVALYVDVVAAADEDAADLKALAARAATDATARLVRWGGQAAAFPGLDERLESP